MSSGEQQANPYSMIPLNQITKTRNREKVPGKEYSSMRLEINHHCGACSQVHAVGFILFSHRSINCHAKIGGNNL